MSSPSTTAAPRFALRHVQLSRAVIAGVAALMITFSPDHSAAIGLSAFSGFGIATALVMFAAAWLTFAAGRRWAPITIGVLSLVAGMTAGIIPWRGDALFFTIIVAWALTTGAVELLAGLRERSIPAVSRAEARDTITVGVLTLVLALAVAVIPAQYALEYTIAEAGATYTLTGTVIAVGVFGGYAAIVAVFLAIAGFSPRTSARAGEDAAPARSENRS